MYLGSLSRPKIHPLRPERQPRRGLCTQPRRRVVGERFLLFPREFNPGYYDYLVGRCREAGFEPEVVRRADPRSYSRATVDRMVASGLGVDLHVPAASHPNSAPPPGVVLKPLRGRAPALKLAAAWRRGHGSGILREFLRVVREVAADDAGGAR